MPKKKATHRIRRKRYPVHDAQWELEQQEILRRKTGTTSILVTTDLEGGCEAAVFLEGTSKSTSVYTVNVKPHDYVSFIKDMARSGAWTLSEGALLNFEAQKKQFGLK